MNNLTGTIKLLLLMLFVLVLEDTHAQGMAVPYSRDFEFTEGAFLSIENFKTNDPIPKSAIISSYPKNQVDFMTQVMDAKYLVYKNREGVEQKIETASLWGYCQNRTLYLNYNNEFNRINVIGTWCHLTAKKYTPVGYTDPMNYNYGINTSDEQHQYVLDTQADKVHDFNVASMEALLESDPELHTEFMKIKRRKKPDFIFIYLRKYNEKHPLLITTTK